ncbi:MAG: ubiquitin-like domain-containing protein [Bacteroidota bacterium]
MCKYHTQNGVIYIFFLLLCLLQPCLQATESGFTVQLKFVNDQNDRLIPGIKETDSMRDIIEKFKEQDYLLYQWLLGGMRFIWKKNDQEEIPISRYEPLHSYGITSDIQSITMIIYMRTKRADITILLPYGKAMYIKVPRDANQKEDSVTSLDGIKEEILWNINHHAIYTAMSSDANSWLFFSGPNTLEPMDQLESHMLGIIPSDNRLEDDTFQLGNIIYSNNELQKKNIRLYFGPSRKNNRYRVVVAPTTVLNPHHPLPIQADNDITTPLALKQLIQDKWHIPAAYQKLTYQDQLLANDTLLTSYEIPENGELLLSLVDQENLVDYHHQPAFLQAYKVYIAILAGMLIGTVMTYLMYTLYEKVNQKKKDSFLSN